MRQWQWQILLSRGFYIRITVKRGLVVVPCARELRRCPGRRRAYRYAQPQGNQKPGRHRMQASKASDGQMQRDVGCGGRWLLVLSTKSDHEATQHARSPHSPALFNLMLSPLIRGVCRTSARYHHTW